MLGAIILAGGPSSRFRRNKALIELNGKPLIRYVIDQCQTVAEKIVVAIGKDDSPELYASALPSNAKIIKDRVQHRNPLVGIAAGIDLLDTVYSIVVPCDTPFVRNDVLKFMYEEACGFDAAIPKWSNGYIEPLHAVYCVESTKRVLPRVLRNENSRVSSLASTLDAVKYVDMKEISKLDNHLNCFFNINSLQDLKLAEVIQNARKISITI